MGHRVIDDFNLLVTCFYFPRFSLLFSCFGITLVLFSCKLNNSLRRKKKVSKEKKGVWVNVCPDKWFLLCTTGPGKIKGRLWVLICWPIIICYWIIYITFTSINIFHVYGKREIQLYWNLSSFVSYQQIRRTSNVEVTSCLHTALVASATIPV